MKKIIFILVILAVLLFSGCDAMLEVFYPELTDEILDNFNENNNTLVINYSYNAYHMNNYGYDTNIPLKLELYDRDEGDTPASGDKPVRSVKIFGKSVYSHEFHVPAGNYNIWIWQDKYDDGWVGSGDFAFSGNVTGSIPNHEFFGGEEKHVFSAYTWLTF